MKVSKLTIILCCLLTALACSAAKYQIKVLNTPTINIDSREAKVGDWFSDESVIVWSRDNQAMRVVSDNNKVYTLSAKLYKEAKAKKFSDFILYTKPLAARGTNDLDLIEQLAERFDNTFVMLDEIVIDLSGLSLPRNACFILNSKNDSYFLETTMMIPYDDASIIITRNDIKSDESHNREIANYKVYLWTNQGNDPEMITDSFVIEILPMSMLPTYEYDIYK